MVKCSLISPAYPCTGEEIKTCYENFEKLGFNEVQDSNMSKLDESGKPIYNDAGKVMKGPKYFKPNLSKFIS